MLKPPSPHFAKPFVIIFSLLFVFGVALWLTLGSANQSSETPSPVPSETNMVDIHETTTEGTMTCLPHKDTSGPTTLECAYGIKTASGDYYALDNALYPGTIGSIPITAKVRVTGKITPLEELEKVRPNVYDIKGAIVVADIEEL